MELWLSLIQARWINFHRKLLLMATSDSWNYSICEQATLSATFNIAVVKQIFRAENVSRGEFPGNPTESDDDSLTANGQLRILEWAIKHSAHCSTHSDDVNEPKIQFFKSACEEFRRQQFTACANKENVGGEEEEKSKSEKLWQGRTTRNFCLSPKGKTVKDNKNKKPEHKKAQHQHRKCVFAADFFLRQHSRLSHTLTHTVCCRKNMDHRSFVPNVLN